MTTLVGNALGAVATRSGLTTLASLPRVNEQQILEQIARTNSDQRVINRVNDILASSMSFVKS